jgi:hypothetical protein
MPVYSASSTQWPLLQSKTEQKFKSGLFTVSAEYIRPVGNGDLPAVIVTSIGNVDVWPEPTVSVGTDGFERVNATGYGVWDETIQEVVTSISREFVYATGTSSSVITEGPGCGGYNFPIPLYFGNPPTHPKPVFVESVMIKKIGNELPSTPTLKIYDYLTFQDITNSAYSLTDFGLIGTISSQTYDGNFAPRQIPLSAYPSTIKTNVYGSIIELEVSYAIGTPLLINFGHFVQKYPENLNCS